MKFLVYKDEKYTLKFKKLMFLLNSNFSGSSDIWCYIYREWDYIIENFYFI